MVHTRSISSTRAAWGDAQPVSPVSEAYPARAQQAFKDLVLSLSGAWQDFVEAKKRETL